MKTIQLILLYMSTSESVSNKFVIWLVVTLLVSLPAYLFEHYISSQIEFLFVLNAIIILDIITGIWKHYRRATLDKEEFIKKLIVKVGVAFLGWAFFHTVAIILSDSETAKGYFILTGQTSVCVYIGLSVMDNLFDISNGKYPPAYLMAKFKNYNKTGKFENLEKSN